MEIKQQWGASLIHLNKHFMDTLLHISAVHFAGFDILSRKFTTSTSYCETHCVIYIN